MCCLSSGGWKSKIQVSAGPLLSQTSILGHLHRVFPLDVSVSSCLPSGSVIENLPADAGDAGLIPRSGRFPREEMAAQASILAWIISRSRKESDTTERLSAQTCWVRANPKNLILTRLHLVHLVKAMVFQESYSNVRVGPQRRLRAELKKTLESPLDCKEIKPVNPKGNQS